VTTDFCVDAIEMAKTILAEQKDCIVMVNARGVELCRLAMEAAPFLACDTAMKLAIAAASECKKTVGPSSCQTSELGQGAGCTPLAGSDELCSIANPGDGGYPLHTPGCVGARGACLGGVGIFGKSSLSDRESAMEAIEERLIAGTTP